MRFTNIISINKNIPIFLKRKEKRVGSAQKKRQYDLPLSTDEGTVFLALLIALMTFLAIMAISSSFALGEMTSRWSNGLEKQATIEIPAQMEASSSLRSPEDIQALQGRIKSALQGMPMIESIDVLSEKDIAKMVSPWLGDNFAMDNIPMPGLISLKLYSTSEKNMGKITQTLKAISPDIRLDTHERWLADLFRLSGALNFAAIFITVIIGLTTVTAVAGAIRSRMAIYQADIELLHLMGARDHYIMKQFQRHALILAFKGAVIGTSIGMIILLAIGWISGDTATALLGENGGLSHGQFMVILSLPFVACGIAALSARHTVLRVLSLMP